MLKLWKGKNPNYSGFFIPRSIQKSIPIQKIYEDGIFAVAGLYSKTWRFYDVNYAVASKEKKESLFLSYCAFLNALPVRTQVKITLFNRTMNQKEFSKSILMQMRGDGRDRLRAEFNDILSSHAASSNHLIQEKYITISTQRKNIQEARSFFQRVSTELSVSLSRMNVKVREVTITDRMRLFHDFFRPADSDFYFDLPNIVRSGHDFKDSIAPDYMTFRKDFYEMGKHVGRVLFLRDYASFIQDEMITELSELPRNMMISINLMPIPTDEVIKEINRRMMAIESDIAQITHRQNAHQNYNATIPFPLLQRREHTKELYGDVTERDQGLMLGQVVLTHLADSMEQLNQDSDTLTSIAQGHGCQLSPLTYQQEDGLNTVLPYGLQRIETLRSLTTESTAVLMPFKAQEIQDSGGIYYGINAVSHNLIVCDRSRLQNGNGFILGVSGSGKSMAAKQELTALALNTDHDILVVDPEREYGSLIQSLGGEVVTISASDHQNCFINALDLSDDYGDGRNPLVLKSEFIMSLCEQIMSHDQLGAREKSIIDRCTSNIYREYVKTFRGTPPTLQDLCADLMKQKEPAAHEIALSLELFTTGNLNIFAHQTNINTQNRILSFDIHDLGDSLKPIGLLVMLDAIYNRVIRNRNKGRFTHVYIDEIYLFFTNHAMGSGQKNINLYSGEFLYKCWKRFRKYGACLTGITQNFEECLKSDTARLMFANSEFVLMFNQASTDRKKLADVFESSETQMDYVNNSPVGHGLIKVGGSMVPFVNEFPKDTELYQLISTNPNEH